MDVIPFLPSHLHALILQDSQAWMEPMMRAGYADEVAHHGPCFTLTDGVTVYACAGIIHVWDGRAQAWALISKSAGQCMVRLYRAIRQFLDDCTIRRIEATVDAGFMPGHRMLLMLGFKRETSEPMRAYLPDGRNCHLYARVNHVRS